MTSLLATNDFPPKVGGIQSYLYELWRRLPPADTTVFTTSFPGAAAWDEQQEFRIERARQRFLLPTRALSNRVDTLARDVGASVVFVDPMLPLGLIGPRLDAAPYVVLAHGAEVTVYGRIPVSGRLARRVLQGAAGVVAGGQFAARAAVAVARRPLSTLVVPPGVDVDRFRPLDEAGRDGARRHFGLDPEVPLVVGVSRLVPRKGFDVLLAAVATLDGVHIAIAGGGRDADRLARRASGLGARARLLGPVSDDELPMLYGCADVFAMPCRERWAGLEAEGFGIVFLEAAACGIPAIAGASGGAVEAVADGETGYVVEPRDVRGIADALGGLLGDEALRTRLGTAARARVESQFSLDTLADRLAPLAAGDLGVLTPFE